MDCQEQIYSNDYADYIVELVSGTEWLQSLIGDFCIETIGDQLGVLHLPRTEGLPELWEAYRGFPKCYALLDTSNLEAIGVQQLRRQPYLDLYGQGVLMAVVDTGIDYTHPAFRYGDGSSRVALIWDQTIPSGDGPSQEGYGTVFTRDQINEALSSDRPFEVVPSRDTNGHGTFLAGVAAGNIMENEGFSGVAPLADLVVVKLKEAKPYLREYYRVPDGVPCYQETDLLLALRFLMRLSAQRQQSMVILMALGTNTGGHDGSSYVDRYMTAIQQTIGRSISVAAGNEVGWGHHYKGLMGAQETVQEVELRVGEGENGFVMELWAEIPDIFSVGFVTPSGYATGRIPYRSGRVETINFAFEPVTVEVAYGITDPFTGDTMVGMRLLDPTPGIWRMQVYREDVLGGRYDIWLPVVGFIQEDTRFTRPDPDTTICDPANTENVMASAAYNHRDGSIFLHSSRGYTRLAGIKPDVAAPGVAVTGPAPGGRFTEMTGTSVAAAETAGVMALMLEYLPSLTGTTLRKFLLRGARRQDMTYPNREFGYGTLNIYTTLEILGGGRI